MVTMPIWAYMLSVLAALLAGALLGVAAFLRGSRRALRTLQQRREESADDAGTPRR